MGCFSSKQINTLGDEPGATERKPATNAASPETNVSTARSDHTHSPQAAGAASLPQNSPRDSNENGGLGQIAGPPNTDGHGTASPADSPPETLGQAPLPSARSRQESVSAQPDEALKSSRVKQSVSGGGVPALTDTDITLPTGSHTSTLQIRPGLKIEELRDGLSLPSERRSQRLNALDHTGRLEGKTEPKFRRSFSDVSQAKLGDRVVAVKALRVANIEDAESRMLKRLSREIYVWAALDHSNVLELLGFAFEDGKPCLISPWCDNGTLQECLQKFPNANRRRLVREIAEGLRYLHVQTPPIIHGNLKTANVFVTGDFVAKISDFGGSRLEQLRTGFTTAGLVLTATRYSAPEILQDGQNPSLSSDVFSFACVVLETMTDKCPFWKIQNDVQVITEVTSKKKTPSPEEHPGMEETLWELLRRCWSYEPSGRPKMVDVCKKLAGAGYGPRRTTTLYPTTPEGAT